MKFFSVTKVGALSIPTTDKELKLNENNSTSAQILLSQSCTPFWEIMFEV